jgi:hypothetical protein
MVSGMRALNASAPYRLCGACEARWSDQTTYAAERKIEEPFMYGPDLPTSLDKERMSVAEQIVKFAREIEDPADARWSVDQLLMEWGAKAYRQGRQHMAARIKKCADEWIAAVG